MKEKFILYDMLIQDIETKKLYKFNPSEWTVSEINNELLELSDDETSDILYANELNTSYIYSLDK